MIEIPVSILLLTIAFVKDFYIKNLFFTFGTIGIWCYSLSLVRQRDFRSLPLSLLMIWSLLCVFLRGYEAAGIQSFYPNVFLLSEGFIYLFCGILLLQLIISYTTKAWIYVLVVYVAMAPWLGEICVGHRVSPLAALGAAAAVVLFINKKRLAATLLLGAGAILASVSWSLIRYKWVARPYVWLHMLQEIKEHPWIGVGFNKTLNVTGMVWVNPSNYGWLFRHNDWLYFGVCLGLIGLGLLLWFIIQTFWKLRYSYLVVFPLAMAICSLFQATMFNPYKASIFIILLAMAMLQGCARCNGRTFWGFGQYKDATFELSSEPPLKNLFNFGK